MDFVSLIGSHLKSNEIIEILELYDLDIVYDFDRLYEGSPDVFHVSAFGQGFELTFNEAQELETVFLYILPRDSYSSFPADAMPVTAYISTEEAKEEFKFSGVKYNESPKEIPEYPGLAWIRGEFEGYTTHYQFNDRALEMVTITISVAA